MQTRAGACNDNITTFLGSSMRPNPCASFMENALSTHDVMECGTFRRSLSVLPWNLRKCENALIIFDRSRNPVSRRDEKMIIARRYYNRISQIGNFQTVVGLPTKELHSVSSIKLRGKYDTSNRRSRRSSFMSRYSYSPFTLYKYLTNIINLLHRYDETTNYVTDKN